MEEFELLVKYIKRKILTVCAVAVLLLVTLSIAWHELVITYILRDEEVVTVISYTDDTKLIIGRSGMKLGEDSNVILDYFNPDVKESLIIITEPHDVLIYDRGKLKKIVTVSGTVGDAIKKSGIKLQEGDKLSINKSVPVTENTRVDIQRAFTVTLISDGKKQKLKTVECTVEEFLKKSGVRISDDDIVTPKRTSKLTENTTVRIKRVTYKDAEKIETVKFKTKVRYDDSMYEEQVKVQRKGKNGQS